MGAYVVYLLTEQTVVPEAPMWVRWGFILKRHGRLDGGEIRYFGLPTRCVVQQQR